MRNPALLKFKTRNSKRLVLLRSLCLRGEEDFPTLDGIKPRMSLPAANPATPHQSSFRLHKGRRGFHRHHHMSTLGVVVLIVAIAWALIVLLQPAPKYHLAQTPDGSVDSDEFARQLEAITDTKLQHAGPIDVLANGENFYEAELEAIHNAKNNVNLEAYIFHRGKIAQRFIDALAERARAGVQVRMVIDALGSFRTPKHYFQPLMDAGGRVEW